MAETIVNWVLGKLVDAAVKEVLSIYHVDEQVEKVSRELKRIQAFIKDADRKQIANERQKNWVKEIREVAHSIEDVIDTFLMEIPQNPPRSGKREVIKKMLRKTKKLPAVHNLVHEMNQIQEKMKEIEESRVRYGIDNLGEGSGAIRLPVRPMVLHDIDPDIVGFKADQDRIVKELLDENTKRRSVVSIWGPGGLGKTTLAQKVYNRNDVQTQFEVRIWVAISEKFEVIDVSRKIALQLNYKLEQLPHEAELILSEINKSLRDKKYLIVLDDVWTTDLWTKIGGAFPNKNNGSRVLVTTRFAHVSKTGDSMCEPYELQYLTEDLSRELLLKTIFPNHDPNSSFDDISDILGKFIHKCGGLPLALVVLGGLLSKKPRSHAAWSSVFRTMSWHVEGLKDCSEIIGTSYEDLPFALKSCFMYLAAYPEDYDIDAEQLLRMWIAEGFIPQEDNRTLEETAESFLEDLVQRSMVQVKRRSSVGSISIIRIYDLLRDLAIQKAKEDNFLLVYSHPNDKMSLSRARRVAIHNSDCDQLTMSPNLHTLLCFDTGRMPNCSKHRLLKVVMFGRGSAHNQIELGMFEGLTQIRYLRLCGWQNDECDQEFYEKVIGRMKYLQTFHVFLETFVDGSSSLKKFPEFAWNIKTLRHVNYSGQFELPASANLTNLQTIESLKVPQSWERELPHVPNLRSLSLDATSSPSKAVVTFLSKLEHLTYLSIDHDYSLPDIFDMRNFLFYQHLQSLKISFHRSHDLTFLNSTEPQRYLIPLFKFLRDGFTKWTLHEDMLPCHLIHLEIYSHRFQQDIMPVLEKLRCLKALYLKSTRVSQEMRCSSGGFSQLESLELDNLPIERWEIEEGALPILKELDIYECDELGVPQGLQYLTSLQKLKWNVLKDNAKADLVRNLCQHVPSLVLDYPY